MSYLDAYHAESLPQRGDVTEAWLKEKRDEYVFGTGEWWTLDVLLNEYRLHADTGTPLNEHVCEGSHCDCE